MNILDSSAWLEFFVGGNNASKFTSSLERTYQLLVPTIVIYEVFKKILKERGEEVALNYVGVMKQGKVVDLDIELSVLAATLSKENRLAMADSIILATAQRYNAMLWTQDADFKGLPGVKYFPKK